MVFNLRRVLELLLACALPYAKPLDYSPIQGRCILQLVGSSAASGDRVLATRNP